MAIEQVYIGDACSFVGPFSQEHDSQRYVRDFSSEFIFGMEID